MTLHLPIVATLNLPAYPVKVIRKGESHQIFDEFRKKYVNLTPEEWVRQLLCHHMVSHLNYPAGRMAIEGKIIHNGIEGRYDVLVYDAHGKPWMVVECKAPEVKLTNAVADQAMRYAKASGAQIILLSNGIEHLCFQFNKEGYTMEREIPIYKET